MGKVDGLSRRLDWKVGVDRDNENQVVIKENWVRSLQEIVIEGPEVDIVERIKKARSKDKDVVRVVEEMKRAKVKELRGEEWKIEGELCYELMSLESDNRTTLVLSNTRELDRVPSTE